MTQALWHHRKTNLVVAMLLLLVACTQSTPTSTYLERLSNVLNVEIPQAQRTEISFPEVRTIKIAEAEQQISIREFLGLRQCKLHLAIAERNSQMGKVASSSQRLKNDLDILNHGPACVTKIENDVLKEKLITYLEVKRTDLPIRLWHAILAEPEYRKLWSAQSQTDDYPSQISGTAVSLPEDLEALNQFVTAVLEGKTAFSATEFDAVERQLGRIRLGDAGQMLNHLLTLSADLERANNMIKQRLQRKLCANNTATPNARNFANVVNKFFIESVQAQAVKLMRRKEQIMPAIKQLENELKQYAKPEFNDWVERRDSLLASASTATKTHAVLIQQLYEQCGLRAGNNLK